MSENHTPTVESLQEQVRELADAIGELAEAQAREGSDDESESQEGGEICGATTQAGNPCQHAKGACPHHRPAKDDAGDDAISPEGIDFADIEAVVTNASEARLRATVEARDWNAPDDDTLATATAKCLIRAKKGGKSQYVTVFGECPHDDCSYGRNGFERDTCKRHASDDANETREASGGEPKSQDSGGMTRAQYEAALVAEGVGPREAAKHANERFE